MRKPLKLAVFKEGIVRRTWLDGEWYFSILDIVAALTGSEDPQAYWSGLKRKELSSTGADFSSYCRKLTLRGTDGSRARTDCVDTMAAFRIIQSIPGPEAEKVKRWLAGVGYEEDQKNGSPIMNLLVHLSAENEPETEGVDERKKKKDIAGGR